MKGNEDTPAADRAEATAAPRLALRPGWPSELTPLAGQRGTEGKAVLISPALKESAVPSHLYRPSKRLSCVAVGPRVVAITSAVGRLSLMLVRLVTVATERAGVSCRRSERAEACERPALSPSFSEGKSRQQTCACCVTTDNRALIGALRAFSVLLSKRAGERPLVISRTSDCNE